MILNLWGADFSPNQDVENDSGADSMNGVGTEGDSLG